MCSPAAGERFFLRLLLTVVRGPISYEDLRTVDGGLHPTFRASCLARGLLENDGEWVRAFDEGALVFSGHALRRDMAIALTSGDVSDPLALWTRFRQALCDDLPPRLRRISGVPAHIAEPLYDYGLYILEQALQDFGKTLADFALPSPDLFWTNAGANGLLDTELEYDTVRESLLRDQTVAQLNADQRFCFDTIVAAVEQRLPSPFFFLQGPGGTGKTFLYSALCHYFRSKESMDDRIVICVASSGIASLLLIGGTTAHSRFKIPIDITANSTCAIRKNILQADLFRRATILNWDEVPMHISTSSPRSVGCCPTSETTHASSEGCLPCSAGTSRRPFRSWKVEPGDNRS